MPEKTKYKYIKFEPKVSTGKTELWSCKNAKTGTELGEVKWYSGWRQYCYFPLIEAVYSKGCLEDITGFIKQLMAERKPSKPNYYDVVGERHILQNMEVWDWVVTHSGKIRQITSDDMNDLKSEDIARFATIKEREDNK